MFSVIAHLCLFDSNKRLYNSAYTNTIFCRPGLTELNSGCKVIVFSMTKADVIVYVEPHATNLHKQ